MTDGPDWKRTLARLVAAAVAVGLAACPDLRDFYALCDGGTLALQYTAGLSRPSGSVRAATVRERLPGE